MKKYINRADAVCILIEYFYVKGGYEKTLKESEIDPEYITFLVEDIRTFDRLRAALPAVYDSLENTGVIDNARYDFMDMQNKLK